MMWQALLSEESSGAQLRPGICTLIRGAARDRGCVRDTPDYLGNNCIASRLASCARITVCICLLADGVICSADPGIDLPFWRALGSIRGCSRSVDIGICANLALGMPSRYCPWRRSRYVHAPRSLVGTRFLKRSRSVPAPKLAQSIGPWWPSNRGHCQCHRPIFDLAAHAVEGTAPNARQYLAWGCGSRVHSHRVCHAA